jgi:hypothetical protein
MDPKTIEAVVGATHNVSGTGDHRMQEEEEEAEYEAKMQRENMARFGSDFYAPRNRMTALSDTTSTQVSGTGMDPGMGMGIGGVGVDMDANDQHNTQCDVDFESLPEYDLKSSSVSSSSSSSLSSSSGTRIAYRTVTLQNWTPCVSSWSIGEIVKREGKRIWLKDGTTLETTALADVRLYARVQSSLDSPSTPTADTKSATITVTGAVRRDSQVVKTNLPWPERLRQAKQRLKARLENATIAADNHC